jgi:hypothetical protein
MQLVIECECGWSLHIFRCAGGRIAEHWGVFDMLGILQQLGAVPA